MRLSIIVITATEIVYMQLLDYYTVHVCVYMYMYIKLAVQGKLIFKIYIT